MRKIINFKGIDMPIPEIPFSDFGNKDVLKILDFEIKEILILRVIEDSDNTIHNPTSLIALFDQILVADIPTYSLFRNDSLRLQN